MKNTTGKSFVTIMIVVAFSALLLRSGTGALLQMNIAQNESSAQGTLKLIAAALENYANDNHDTFPSDFSLLIQSRPAYLDRDYVSSSPVKGYQYGCAKLGSSEYDCFARPVRCGLSGRRDFAISQGGQLVSTPCREIP